MGRGKRDQRPEWKEVGLPSPVLAAMERRIVLGTENR
jgi:hypothetical protein